MEFLKEEASGKYGEEDVERLGQDRSGWDRTGCGETGAGQERWGRTGCGAREKDIGIG